MKRYSKFLAVLLTVAMLLPGMTGIVEAAPTNDKTVERVHGDTRVGTAVEASKKTYNDGTNSVILAGYNGTVDALTGTLLAKAENAPLLLTHKDELSKETKEEIERLEADNVYIVGGENVVSKKVENTLAKNYTVERVAGNNREETAQKIAEKSNFQTDHVFLALGHPVKKDDALSDALAIGAASAKEEIPVLLTQKDRLSKATKVALKELGVKKITIVGGKSAITENVVSELKNYDVAKRIAGTRREETALKIANKYFPDSEKAVVTYGWNDADALVGGYLGAKIDAPILLSNTNKLHNDVETFLKNNTNFAYVLGGKTVISEDILDSVQSAIQKKTDLTAYNKVLEAVNKNHYTDSSWAEYQKVVKANVVTKENTQDEVNTAILAIILAQNNLIKVGEDSKPDPEPEELTVKSATAINSTTLEVILSDGSEHIVTLDKALEENIATEVTFTIDENKYTRKVIWKVYIKDDTDLTTYNKVLNSVDKDDYTDSSWEEYQKVLKDNVVTKENTQAEVNIATITIAIAQNNLKKVGEDPKPEPNQVPITIIGYNGSNKDIEIPSLIEGDKINNNEYKGFVISESIKNNQTGEVTTIGGGAFEDGEFRSVIIPDSVTQIDPWSFANSNINKIEIPDSVNEIGSYAFSGNQLGDIKIPKNITKIKSSSFSGNQLGDIKIPSSVNEIEGYAFGGNKLTSLTIPDTVTQIGEGAFAGNQLEKIDFSANMTKISERVFENNQLSNLTIPNNITQIDEGAFAYNKLESIELSSAITHIDDRVFEGNKFKSFKIPDNIKSIGSESFARNQLTGIKIPNSVNEIGPYAFSRNKIKNINLSENITEIGEGVFSFNKLTSLNIPDKVTKIGHSAFSDNLLNNITIPDTVNNIGKRAFSDNWLNELTISKNITEISDGAFAGNELTSLDIPNKVTQIGESAFASNQLIDIEIPDSVNEIGAYAFSRNELKSVNLSKNITEIAEGVFSFNKLTNLNIPNKVTKIRESAFTSNQLTDIKIPDTVNEIGRRAFSDNQLTDIEIPNNITQIESSAFSDNQLREIRIPSSVNEIGSYAFSGNKLTSLTIPNNVSIIHELAFAYNIIDEIIIPKNVLIANNFLGYDSSFKKIYLEKGEGTYKKIEEVWKKQS